MRLSRSRSTCKESSCSAASPPVYCLRAYLEGRGQSQSIRFLSWALSYSYGSLSALLACRPSSRQCRPCLTPGPPCEGPPACPRRRCRRRCRGSQAPPHGLQSQPDSLVKLRSPVASERRLRRAAWQGTHARAGLAGSAPSGGRSPSRR